MTHPKNQIPAGNFPRVAYADSPLSVTMAAIDWAILMEWLTMAKQGVISNAGRDLLGPDDAEDLQACSKAAAVFWKMLAEATVEEVDNPTRWLDAVGDSSPRSSGSNTVH